ncbi:MAG: type II secretion system protein [Phycisphaerales bacterium]
MVEVLVTIGVVAILVSLAVPAFGQMRRRSRELLCLSRASQLQVLVATYAQDARGVFPAQFSDRPADLTTPPERSRYGRYPYRAFAEGPMTLHSGLLPGAAALACPMNQFMREGSTSRWTVDYSITSAAYLESRYLSLELPEDQRSNMIARIAFLDDALFPSAKAAVYEAQVWHAWPGFYSLESAEPVNELFHWGTNGRISISFLDCHAEQVLRHEITPAVYRTPEVLNSILNTTPYGMRGRDLR